MKNKIFVKNSILIIFSFLLIVVFFTFIILKTTSNKTSTSNDDYINEQVEYKIYENKSIGIKLKYPKNFDKIEEVNNNENKEVVFYDENNGRKINITITNIKQIYDFVTYKNSKISSLKNTYNLSDEDIKIDEYNITIDNIQALTYSYVYSGMSFYQCIVVRDEKEYIINYSTTELNFNKENVNEIFKSLEFIDNEKNVEIQSNNSKESPADINVWCKVSKYTLNDEASYQDVYVKVTSITRGEEAKKIVEEYMKEDNYFINKNLNSFEEWVVVSYDVDMQNIDMPDCGVSAHINASIIGKGNYDVIKYNSNTYLVDVQMISSNEYVKNNYVSNKIAFVLPIDYSDYIIRFGVYNKTQAFIKGI